MPTTLKAKLPVKKPADPNVANIRVAISNQNHFDAVFAKPAQSPSLPSLKSQILSGVPLESCGLTNEQIVAALASECWRTREVGETIRENDLIMYIGFGNNTSESVFERVYGYKDVVLTQDMLELNSMSVYTLEGGGKKRKPIVYHETKEYNSIFDVPRGTRVRLPIDENEAIRFFGSDVVITEVADSGRLTKCFYPVPSKMADRKFRRVFSRVFPDFARRHLREHIKGLIRCRGTGLSIKKFVSTKRILRLYQPYRKDDNKRPLSCEEIDATLNLPSGTAELVIARHQNSVRPIETFKSRMAARSLTPQDFNYDKGLGIEIETVCNIGIEKASELVPSFVRCATDGSIRADPDKDLKPDNVKTFGVEFRILIKRSDMESRVVRALEAISSKCGAKVNRSCGLHVHFDMRDKNPDQFTRIHKHVKTWLSFLKEIVPASRRENKYCNFSENGGGNPHWEAVSSQSYRNHRTLEIRLHSSTLNPIKVIRWIHLIETIMATPFTPPGKPSTLDALKMLSLSDTDRTYWLKRHQQLNQEMYRYGTIDLSFLGDKNVNEAE